MCSALRVAGEACAACGFLPPPPPPRAVACLPGDLDEVDRSGRTIPAQEHSHDERMLFFGEMAAYGRARGFKPGFAAARYRERYHNWPPWGAAPPSVDEIRPATRRWLQSRAIAYARAREREERP